MYRSRPTGPRRKLVADVKRQSVDQTIWAETAGTWAAVAAAIPGVVGSQIETKRMAAGLDWVVGGLARGRRRDTAETGRTNASLCETAMCREHLVTKAETERSRQDGPGKRRDLHLRLATGHPPQDAGGIHPR